MKSVVYLVLLVTILDVKQLWGQEVTSDYCPAQCECEETTSSGLVTATCDGLNSLSGFDFISKDPPVRDLRLVVTNSDIDEVGDETLDMLAENNLILVLENTHVGTFRAGSLSIPNLAKLSIDLQESTIDTFEADTISSNSMNVQAFIFQDSRIETIHEGAFSGTRFNLIEWSGVSVGHMADGAFHGSSIVNLILRFVTMEGDSKLFTQLDLIQRLQMSFTELPVFPAAFIPERFATDQTHAENTYIHDNVFRQVEDRAFYAAYDQDAQYQYMAHLRENQFYNNSVACDVRVDWMMGDPAYLPDQFYHSLICSAPELFCSAILHTCSQLSNDMETTCDFDQDYDCSSANTVHMQALGVSMLVALLAALQRAM